jgi:ABC-type branched-subunit amino acid transport system permease subunit
MIPKSTILHSLYAGFAFVILTLTGIFGTFAGRDVIRGELDLSALTFALMIGCTAYMIGARFREKGLTVVIVNAVVASLIVASMLALVVLFEASNDLRFMFANLGRSTTGNLSGTPLTAGRAIDVSAGDYRGLFEMLGFSAIFGALIGIFSYSPRRLQEVIFTSLALTFTLSLSQGQLNNIITFPDVVALALALIVGYLVAIYAPIPNDLLKLGAGAGLGLVLAIGLMLLAGDDIGRGDFLYGTGTEPVVLTMLTSGKQLGFFILMMVLGVTGAFLARAPKQIHDSFWYFVAGVVALGVLNASRRADNVWYGTIGVFSTLAFALTLVPRLGDKTQEIFTNHTSRPLQRNTQWFLLAIVALIFLIVPQFMGLYIANVFNQIALYTIMGIGLNVMVGYTGLLDLGYVSSFAIGAYTLGVLTTPSLITCGGTVPANVTEAAEICNTLTFWQAWPISIIFSGVTGMILGIPVLRLRGDYLAIVTLGFGEIISRIIGSNDFKDLLGGAQGIPAIPSPVLNVADFNFTMNSSVGMYYLFLFSVILTMFVVYQLVNSRTGRAWRAIKADEDVAQAMGINLMRNKLLAFAISSAFAGLGGAVFGASVQGIFPRSFTLMVSINVLCLIIIGGMGSIPGVILGSFILIGLPELLRELDAYRLLVFGVLLVLVMLVKSEGLLPPKPAELARQGEQARGKTQEGLS